MIKILIPVVLAASAPLLWAQTESPAPATTTRIFNIQSYGAIGDGVTLDTEAIQKAIDACHESSAGLVRVPAGNYHIGTIKLKSNVTLSLDYGAILLGSQNISDYDSNIAPPLEGGRLCLIFAENADNISIEGLGEIDGRGTPEAFPRKSGSPRPHLLRFSNCNKVKFSGVTYKRPASWGLNLIDCKDLHFTGVTVRFKDNGYNNDGLDIDGCENVLIENCDISAGDDAICLKSSLNPCKNVVVRDCKVSSDTAPLKLGTSSHGGFINVDVSNCYFYDSPMGAIKLQLVDGGRLENVSISRITMKNVGNPIFIRLGNRGRNYEKFNGQKYGADVEPEGVPIGTLKNVRISDVTAEVTGEDASKSGPIMIAGIPEHRIENVTLENISISYPGGGPTDAVSREVPEDIARYPEQFFFGVLPAWGVYLRHVDGIRLDNVSIESRSADPRPAVIFDDVLNYEASDFSANGTKINADRTK